MRYCKSNDLVPGMVLAKSLYSDKNELLLASGNELTEKLIKRIRQLEYSHVCIEQEGTEDIIIGDIIDEPLLRKARKLLIDLFEGVIHESKKRSCESHEDLIKDLQTSNYVVPIDGIRKVVGEIVDEMLLKDGTYWDAIPEAFSKRVRITHGVDAAILSILMGIWYSFSRNELDQLGLGAILHDLGLALMPDIAWKRRDDYKSDEVEHYLKHPEFGAKLLENHKAALHVVIQCLLQHHERQDGGGFPQGLRGNHKLPTKKVKRSPDEIFRFAEIISVADAYINLTNGTWSETALSPEDALTYMNEELSSMLNKSIISALSRIVVRFPAGVTVSIEECSNNHYVGFRGVVAKPNLADPHRATVILIADAENRKIEPIPADFRAEKNARIRMII